MAVVDSSALESSDGTRSSDLVVPKSDEETVRHRLDEET